MPAKKRTTPKTRPAKQVNDTEPATVRQAIVVLGMHRSGTSALTRVLNYCGATLPKTLMRARDDNPAGFWESTRLFALNEEILESASSRWDDIGDFPQSWFTSNLMPRYRQRMAALLTDEFADDSLMVIKDPRACRLVPIFDAALRDIGAQPRYIIPLRSPLEVAASLNARDNFAPARGMLLWLRHLLDAERFTRDKSREFVCYDELLTDWRKVVGQIGGAFDIQWPRISTRIEAEIDQFLRVDLKHQNASVETLEERSDVAEHVKQVFRAVLQAANGAPLDTVSLDETRRWLKEADRLFVPIVKDAEVTRDRLELELKEIRSDRDDVRQQLIALEKDIQQHKLESKRTEQWILELQRDVEDQQAARECAEKRLVTLEDDIDQYETKIKRKARWAHELQRELQDQRDGRAEVDAWAQSLSEQLEAEREARQSAQAQLELIRSSTSWRAANAIHALTGGIASIAFQISRTIFRATPMPAKVRWRIKNRLRHVHQQISSAQAAAPAAYDKSPKSAYRTAAREKLNRFLRSHDRLKLPAADKPRVSIILILYNQAELTLACLQSLQLIYRNDMEVIIWDNASSDDTRRLLDKVEGAKVILHEENLHFLRGCNEAAKHTCGEYLVFLNNDAQVHPGSLDAALQVFEEEHNVGAVGGPVVLLDGKLQEAGNIIWSDGSCLGYGRGGNPSSPLYGFRRDVDYVSGAFLVTPRSRFTQLGGFDEAFAPAYYEETDYCMRLWREGLRVVYEPGAVITHFEFGSSSGAVATDLMKRNQTRFVEQHSADLEENHWPPASKNIIHARSHHCAKPRVLYIDDKFPHLDIGQGFPRSNFILAALAEKGFRITLFATNQSMEARASLYRDISPRVECFCGSTGRDLQHLLQERPSYFDYIFVSRPHNMESMRYLLADAPYLQGRAKIVYDAEALFCSRDIAKHELKGKPLSERRRKTMVDNEVALADIADAVITVSEAERQHFLGRVSCDIHVVGHAMEPTPGEADFQERRDFVFVGALPDDDNPNTDSIRWFITQVWPKVRASLGDIPASLRIVGLNQSQAIQTLSGPGVEIVGPVKDLEAIYHRARVMIIPTRYAAGIPFKAHEATKFGVPMVTTSLIAQQLGWTHERELLSAPWREPQSFADCCVQLYTDPHLWRQIREQSLDRLGQDCSVASQVAAIQACFPIAATTSNIRAPKAR